MGGRSGSSSVSIMGSGIAARRARADIRTKLERAPPEAAAEAAVQALAISHPAIAALYAAYKVAKFIYPIVGEGMKTYEKTGDKEQAVNAMKNEVIKQTAKEIVSATVSTVVGVAVDRAEEAAKITIDKTTDTFVKAAISEIANEVIT